MTIELFDTERESLSPSIADRIQDASTEISPRDEALLPNLRQILPEGIDVYVAHPPVPSLRNVLRVAVRTEKWGFHAWPHVAANVAQCESHVRAALRELVDSGIDQLLLVAGDHREPSGSPLRVLALVST